MNHQSSNPRMLLLGGLGLAVLVGACASLGTPDDQQQGAALWGEMGNYKSWGHFAGHEGMQKGKSPHGKYIFTFVNSAGAGHPDAPPAGSIIVKENYSSQESDSLKALTVMKKIDGYDSDNGDWFWARYEPSGTLTHAGRVSMCADCHLDAGGDDFVFLND